jgi:hypothetical protein
MPGRFFQGCLYLLGGVIVLNLAVCLIKQIWVWLLLGGLFAATIGLVVWWLRRRRHW